MPEIIRTKERVYRQDNDSSDDDRSSSYSHARHSNNGGYKTVKSYRITPSRSRVVEDIDDDRFSRRGNYSSRLEVDRVQEVDRIERPRSALEYRDSGRDRNTTRTIVYENDRSPEPRSARPWEREERPWEREKETDIVRVERRRDRDDEGDYERVTRETEYYGRPEPTLQPIVIRERAPEPQKIIVETAPPTQSYEVIRKEEIIENRQVAPPRRHEDEYYYRRDVREVEPRRDEVARYERRRDHSESGGSDEEVYIRKEKRIVRSGSRSRSHSPRHRLHLAEGALAGAGAAALISNHRSKSGQGSEHRGRKVAGGAALGALGAELVTKARSRRHRDSSRDRDRSRSSSRGHGNHTKLKTGLAIAATALAAAAAGKYISNRNERKEETGRGRSRTRSVSRRRRYSNDEAEIALEKHTNPKHRAATIAKVGAGAAAVAGVVEHFRSKSRGRSKSRLRTGGIVAATGVAGAALAGVYEARKAKKDAGVVDEHRRHRSRSHSRARSLVYSDPGADEMGMVEYGTNPVHSRQRDAYGYDPAAAAAERSRERHASQSRSRSRVRDIASGALATGAAAIGIKQYAKRKERKMEEQRRRHYEEEAPRDHYYDNDSYDDDYSPSPPRASGGAVYPDERVPPPPVPQAGYPQHPAESVPDLNQYPTHPPYDAAPPATYHQADFPAQPAGVPPVNPYYQAPRTARDGGNVSAITPFTPIAKTPVPRSMYNMADDEAALGLAYPPSTSSSTLSSTPLTTALVALPSDEPLHNKSVSFAPLSPTSTRTLKTAQRQRRSSDPSADRPNIPSQHRRRHNNPSRSPSPDDVEVLPDRFNSEGRHLDEHGRPPLAIKDSEMVERIVHDFGDVLEGRQSWRHLLNGFFEEAAAADGDGGGGRR